MLNIRTTPDNYKIAEEAYQRNKNSCRDLENLLLKYSLIKTTQMGVQLPSGILWDVNRKMILTRKISKRRLSPLAALWVIETKN